MLNKAISVIALSVMLPLCASAQDEYYRNADPTTGVRGRVSAAFDWKVADGLHLNLEEEMRTADGFSSVEKIYSTAGISYKPCPYLKAGMSYSYIIRNRPGEGDADSEWRDKGRLNFDLTGMYRFGSFKLSLRERLQLTSLYYEVNEFQKPSQQLALRSRLKLAYSIPGKPVEPYVSAEMRHALNAVDPESLGKTKSDAGSVSYSDVYADRYRLVAGVEWRLDKRNWLDFYIMGQKACPKVIDTNAEGKLKKIQEIGGEWYGGVTTRCDYTVSIGVAYKFGI